MFIIIRYGLSDFHHFIPLCPSFRSIFRNKTLFYKFIPFFI